MTTTEKINGLKCPYFEDFQGRLDAGETLSFEFNGAGGSQSFWKSSDPTTLGEYVRSTSWYTPKVYDSARQAHNALKRYFSKYGLKSQ